MKSNFKEYFRVAFILFLVAGLSGAIISAVDMITGKRIAENNARIDNEALALVYPEGDFEIIAEDVNDEITRVYKVTLNNELSGYVYKVSGKNAYGEINLIVGVTKDGLLKDYVVTKNTQSYASTVEEHINKAYSENMEQEAVAAVDVKCGATFGAKLFKSLITSTLNHYQENFKGGNE